MERLVLPTVIEPVITPTGLEQRPAPYCLAGTRRHLARLGTRAPPGRRRDPHARGGESQTPSLDERPFDQVRAVAEVIAGSPASLSADDITARFISRGPWKKRVPPLLDILIALGRATEKDGRYRARGKKHAMPDCLAAD